MAKEQTIPEAALRDPNAVEMLRVWIAERSLWCSLRVGMHKSRGLDEPWAWGVTLADAARHIASALASSEGADPSELLQKIRDSFSVELDKPTSGTVGRFVDMKRD